MVGARGREGGREGEGREGGREGGNDTGKEGGRGRSKITENSLNNWQERNKLV